MRTHQRHVRDAIRSGKCPLRVVGSQKDGFVLAVEAKPGIRDEQGNVMPLTVFRPFGPVYPKQADAIDYGLKTFGAKASKVVQRVSKPDKLIEVPEAA